MAKNSKSMVSKILKEVSTELGVSLSSYSDGWVYDLNYKGVHHLIYGYRFGLNTDSFSLLCNDKAAMSEFLTANRVPNLPHTYLPSPRVMEFMQGDEDHYSRLLEAHLSREEVVIKSNDGTGGRDVYKVGSLQEARKALDNIFKTSCACLSPFVDIEEELRLVVVRGEIMLAYKKLPQGDWRHNLCLGAIPEVIEEAQLPQAALKIFLQLKALVYLGSLSVDLVKVAGEYFILEINSGIVMEGFARVNNENYLKSKKVYRKIVEELIKNNDKR